MRYVAMLWITFSLMYSGLTAAENSNAATKAVASLSPTRGSRAQGVITFTSVDGATKIVADVDYLEPGPHALVIHEYGDCSAPDGASIGGHFNPTSKRHGGPDSLERHVGDLGNIFANEKGHAHYERMDNVIKLTGPHSIIGRAIAIHANKDDCTTQPTGNAGGCVACGVID